MLSIISQLSRLTFGYYSWLCKYLLPRVSNCCKPVLKNKLNQILNYVIEKVLVVRSKCMYASLTISFCKSIFLLTMLKFRAVLLLSVTYVIVKSAFVSQKTVVESRKLTTRD